MKCLTGSKRSEFHNVLRFNPNSSIMVFKVIIDSFSQLSLQGEAKLAKCHASYFICGRHYLEFPALQQHTGFCLEKQGKISTDIWREQHRYSLQLLKLL